MQYLMLIYSQEANFARMTPQEVAAMSAEFGKYTEEITKAGKYRGGNRLAPTASATTVRVRDGKRVTTDGCCAASSPARAVRARQVATRSARPSRSRPR